MLGTGSSGPRIRASSPPAPPTRPTSATTRWRARATCTSSGRQRHGGIAQGAAQALLEEVVFDAGGNPLTANLADYSVVSAAELPRFELADSQTPTSYNPLGAKGIGEAGSIGSTPAVQNAIIDAVAHLGVRHIDMPASPQRVWQALESAASV
jgi:aerobic carbon-monoxide dehydrogenase large subunit